MDDRAEIKILLMRMLLEAPVKDAKAIELLSGTIFYELRGRNYIDHTSNGEGKPVTWRVTQKGLDFIKGDEHV